MRWTSLGLSLIEAMHLGMPVVALGHHRGGRRPCRRDRGVRDRPGAAGPGAARAGRRAGAGPALGQAGARARAGPLRARPLPRPAGTSCWTGRPSDSHGRRGRRVAPAAPTEGGDADAHRHGVRAREPAGRAGGADAAGRTCTSGSWARRWPRTGHEVTVWTRRDAPDAPGARHAGPGRRRCGTGRRAGARRCPRTSWCRTCRRWPRRWRRPGARDRPDVVHAPLLDVRDGRARRRGRRWACRSCRPSTRWAASSAATRAPRTPARTGGSRAERAVARGVDRIIATCSDEVFELARLGAPRRRIPVVPCGVDTAAFTPRARCCPRGARPRLVSVGRLVRRKGVDETIAALAAVPDAELVVAGGSGARTTRTRRAAGRAGAPSTGWPTGSASSARLPAPSGPGAAALGRRRGVRALVRAVRHRAAGGDGLRPAGGGQRGRRPGRHRRGRGHRGARAAPPARRAGRRRCASCSRSPTWAQRLRRRRAGPGARPLRLGPGRRGHRAVYEEVVVARAGVGRRATGRTTCRAPTTQPSGVRGDPDGVADGACPMPPPTAAARRPTRCGLLGAHVDRLAAALPALRAAAADAGPLGRGPRPTGCWPAAGCWPPATAAAPPRPSTSPPSWSAASTGPAAVLRDRPARRHLEPHRDRQRLRLPARSTPARCARTPAPATSWCCSPPAGAAQPAGRRGRRGRARAPRAGRSPAPARTRCAEPARRRSACPATPPPCRRATWRRCTCCAARWSGWWPTPRRTGRAALMDPTPGERPRVVS